MFEPVWLAWAGSAFASVDEACQDWAAAGPPEDYNEQAQQDYLGNYYALATTFSPLHAPVPHEGGHGSVGIDVGVLPPVGCPHRMVLNYTQTVDSNKSPVVPRPTVSYAFPTFGRTTVYAGAGYVPPITLSGATSVILSGELGVGFQFGEVFQTGARFHATSMKTVGEIATPFTEGGEVFEDLYVASTFGLDALVGADLDVLTPYLAVGWTDASTFFYVGDDNVVTNNYHPYFGFAGSVGVDALVADHLRLGGEFYAAPGGYSSPVKELENVTPASRYGHLYTGRLRVALEL